MERLTPDQRLQLTKLYYENLRSVRNGVRALQTTNSIVTEFYSAQEMVLQELPMLPERCTVWCGLWAGGIVISKDNTFCNVSFKAVRYKSMISNFFLSKMHTFEL